VFCFGNHQPETFQGKNLLFEISISNYAGFLIAIRQFDQLHHFPAVVAMFFKAFVHAGNSHSAFCFPAIYQLSTFFTVMTIIFNLISYKRNSLSTIQLCVFFREINKAPKQ
jgi:hypothetical protein